MLFRSKTGWIGVDIGTQAVKLAQVRRQSGRFELLGASIVPRADGWYGRQLRGEMPRSSADEIRTGLTAGDRFVGRNSASVLPMTVAEYRHLQTPATTDRQQRAAICEDLGVAAGQGAKALEFDFWATPTRPAETRLHVISLPAQWPRQVLQDHTAAGLNCRVVDAIPLAIARAVQMSDRVPDGDAVAAVDWGFSTVTICIVQEGQAALVRCLREGCVGDLVAAIRRALPVSDAEARQLLVDVGLPAAGCPAGKEEVASILASAVGGALDGVVAELQKTFSFLADSHRELLPRTVQLLGGGATIRSIAPHLSRQLALPVDVWRLRNGQPPNARQGNLADPLLATAIGLSALNGWNR